MCCQTIATISLVLARCCDAVLRSTVAVAAEALFTFVFGDHLAPVLDTQTRTSLTLATSDKTSPTVYKLPQDSLFLVTFQLRNLEFRHHVFQ
jgi:hypothetical protein